MILDRLFPLPDFLGIGAMRAGTSWLAARLADHPQIGFRRKEIHFFDRRIDRRLVPFVPAAREARLRYRCRLIGAGVRGRLVGEFTPAYAVLSPARIAAARVWLPEAKLLFIMRDPVERAWSQARHDFARFLDRDAGDAGEAELREFFERPAVRARGDYAACLENWLAAYPREQLFVTFLEHVRSDAARVLRDAFTFLGVDPEIEVGAEAALPVHQSSAAPLPAWAREYLEGSLRPRDDRIEALVGLPVPWRDGVAG